MAHCTFAWEFCVVGAAGDGAAGGIEPERRRRVGEGSTEDLRQVGNGPGMRRLRRAMLRGGLQDRSRVSACPDCSRLYGSPAALAANRARIELAQLVHFTRLSFPGKRAY